jgi:integrase
MGRKRQTCNFNLKSVSDPEAEELIYFISIVKGKKVKVSTGQKALVKTWNKELQRCNTGSLYTERENRHSKKVNKFLDWLVGEAVREWQFFKSRVAYLQTPENFKWIIQCCIERENKGIQEEEKKALVTPSQFFQQYIDAMPKKIVKSTGTFINPRTIVHHQTVLKRIQDFFREKVKNDNFSVFDKKFEGDFEAWAYTSKNYRSNTIPATFSVLKVWLKEAEKEGLIIDKSFHQYRSKGTDVDNIYLTVKEIEKIYNLDIKDLMDKEVIDAKSKIEVTRDLFVISCYTGLRLGDWSRLNSSVWNLEKNTLTIITSKTGEMVVIPLHKNVRELYHKYNGHFPNSIDKTASIAHLQHLGMLAGIDDEVLIKEIIGGVAVSKKYKKYQLIRNHTGRRSFATNMYLTRAPIIGIMKITGHKTELNFLKYIKITREENAETMTQFIDKMF